MTLEQYSKVYLNQRVKFLWANDSLKGNFGYVVKKYNGNYQCLVWFDGETKPRVVGYKLLESID